MPNIERLTFGEWNNIPNKSPNPEIALAQAQIDLRIRKVFESLTPHQQNLLELYFDSTEEQFKKILRSTSGARTSWMYITERLKRNAEAKDLDWLFKLPS